MTTDQKLDNEITDWGDVIVTMLDMYKSAARRMIELLECDVSDIEKGFMPRYGGTEIAYLRDVQRLQDIATNIANTREWVARLKSIRETEPLGECNATG